LQEIPPIEAPEETFRFTREILAARSTGQEGEVEIFTQHRDGKRSLGHPEGGHCFGEIASCSTGRDGLCEKPIRPTELLELPKDYFPGLSFGISSIFDQPSCRFPPGAFVR